MIGIDTPNYTQVPNVLFDLMAGMKEAELRCTLAIVRKIVGYHKEGPEPISYSQLEKMTGLSRQGVVNGVEDARQRGFIKEAGRGKRGILLFTVNFADQSTTLTSQNAENDATSQLSRLELVNVVDTQKKSFKEKEQRTGPPPSEAHEQTDDPTIGVVTSDDVQRSAVPEWMKTWTDAGYTIGLDAFWWSDKWQKWIGGEIIRLTPAYCTFEYRYGDGLTTEIKRGIKKCSLTGKTDGWTLVKELPDLQRAIAIYAYGMEPDQGVHASRSEELNMHVSDLRGQFGVNGSLPTFEEIRAACGWQQSQGLTCPKARGKLGDIINGYRKTTGQSHKTGPAILPPKHPRSDCPMCGGLGQCADHEGRTVGCPACLQAEVTVTHG